MKSLADLKVQLYADGADKAGILELYAKPYIKGLTTNPSLMKKAGIKDYEAFAKDILQTVTAKPISLEVFTDDIVDMKRQALMINSWGANVYTKIPITNSKGESCLPLIKELGLLGVKLNVTALLTLAQVRGVAEALNPAVPAVVSVFAGRIADTGVDPMPIMRASGALLTELPKAELLWASTREVLNLFKPRNPGAPSSRSPRYSGKGRQDDRLRPDRPFAGHREDVRRRFERRRFQTLKIRIYLPGRPAQRRGSAFIYVPAPSPDAPRSLRSAGPVGAGPSCRQKFRCRRGCRRGQTPL